MNSIQHTYLAAKTRYDTLYAQLLEQMGDVPEREEELVAYVEKENRIARELGIVPAYLALCDAEQALLDWGRDVLSKEKGHTKELDAVFDTTFFSIRNGVVKLCLQLQPEQE